MKTRFLAAILAVACTSASLASAADKLFPLGVWYEGGVAGARDNVLPGSPADAAGVYDRQFADIAAHGINLIVVPNTPPEHHRVLLDAAQRHGLKVIPELGLDGGPVGGAIRDGGAMNEGVVREQFKTVLEEVKNHPAFYRVQLLDEPGNGAPMKHYARVAEMLGQYDPAVKPFTCLAGPGPVGEFCTVVKPDVVAFDFYPYGVDKKVGDLQTLRDYEGASMAAVGEARKVGADCWAVLQCHAITGAIRFPTPEELHCMTWVALGTGNKGVFWFLYQTEHFTPSQVMDGLVGRDGAPRPLWGEVAKLTEELKPLTATLANLRPAEEKPELVRRKSLYPMRDADGKLYLAAVNMDPGLAGKQTLHLHLQTKASKVFRLPGHTEVPSTRDPKDAERLLWHEDFPPGAGALYCVE